MDACERNASLGARSGLHVGQGSSRWPTRRSARGPVESNSIRCRWSVRRVGGGPAAPRRRPTTSSERRRTNLINPVGIRIASRGVPRVLTFPNPVNEVAARLVAAGVVLLSVAILITGQTWLLGPARLRVRGQGARRPPLQPARPVVTQVVVPRLGRAEAGARPAEALRPGHRRHALGRARSSPHCSAPTTLAAVLVGLITVAATLESVFALCIGCKLFALLMRAGVVPAERVRRLRRPRPSTDPRQRRAAAGRRPRLGTPRPPERPPAQPGEVQHAGEV